MWNTSVRGLAALTLMCTARFCYRKCIRIPLFLPFQRSLSHAFLISTYFLMIYFSFIAFIIFVTICLCYTVGPCP